MGQITAGQMVRFTCKTSLEDGTSLDQPGDRDPIEMEAGLEEGNPIALAISAALIGMAAGEIKQIKLAPADAFGEFDDEKLVIIPTNKIGEEVEVGVILEMETDDGQALEGQVVEVKDDKVAVDFNHPLVGQTLVVDLEVL